MYSIDLSKEAKKLSKSKPIDARTHGIIDYAHAALFLTLSAVWRTSHKRASMAAFVTGTVVLLEALVTDYPLGAAPLISFEHHRNIDIGLASSSWLLPVMFGFGGTPQAKVFGAGSGFESAVIGLTDFSNARAERS